MTTGLTFDGERARGRASTQAPDRRLGWVRLLCGVAAAGILSGPLHAAEPALPASNVLAVGLLAHDQGPASDHHEHGIDLNLEAQFAPIGLFGSPRPVVGGTFNFSGNTNTLYAGLAFPLYTSSRWFLQGSISAAVHDGPLHKDPISCQQQSDCGFGVRVLPRIGLDVGYRLGRKSAISLFYGHMSHKWVVGGENEGLDFTGLRYRRPL